MNFSWRASSSPSPPSQALRQSSQTLKGAAQGESSMNWQSGHFSMGGRWHSPSTKYSDLQMTPDRGGSSPQA